MSYLGHQWENEVSILASRITLYLQKEIKLFFLSTAKVSAIGEFDTEAKEWSIRGFCVSQHNIPAEKAEEFVADLNCIHVNRLESSKYDTSFAVCAYPTIMQSWYNMMREGTISMKVMSQLGGCDALTKTSPEKILSLKEEIGLTVPKHVVDKFVLT